MLTDGAIFLGRRALKALNPSPRNFAAAATRLINKDRPANPRHGFFLILRPEDKIIGAPDPVRWIDPLMRHQQLDCRISLLRAAAFHGSAHQAAMVFHLVIPKQVRGKLASLAAEYENSSVRRLGFLLDYAGHERQARALEPFAKKAETAAPLNPAIKPLVAVLSEKAEKSSRWKLLINEPLEIDA